MQQLYYTTFNILADHTADCH